MGIECHLRRVREPVIDALLASPEDTVDVLSLEQAPDGAPRRWGPPNVGRDESLEKDWHALHFLLTGDAGDAGGVASFLLHGGEALDDAELGHPPTRALRPAEVRRVSGFLSALEPEALGERFDPAQMAELEIYPSRGWDDAGAEELESLLDRFEELRAFVAEAA